MQGRSPRSNAQTIVLKALKQKAKTKALKTRQNLFQQHSQDFTQHEIIQQLCHGLTRRQIVVRQNRRASDLERLITLELSPGFRHSENENKEYKSTFLMNQSQLPSTVHIQSLRNTELQPHISTVNSIRAITPLRESHNQRKSSTNQISYRRLHPDLNGPNDDLL